VSARLTLATARRILQQIRHDHRTVALIFGLPTVLMGLLALLLADRPGAFDSWGAPMLGIFPLLVMFLVTSVATLRERTSGTMERLLAMPIGRGDILAGYALAFSLLGAAQAVVVSLFSFGLFGLDIPGSPLLVGVVAVADALLGTALGLAASSLARTEFQAVQMMPLMLLPQFLLCGFIVPQDELPLVLGWLSWLMPLTYGMNAVFEAMEQPSVTAYYLVNLGVVLAFALAALAVGGLTLRRQTR
jgi:ABC-2 type transport system permease protein